MDIENKSNDKGYFTIIPNYIANHSSANDQALYLQMKKIVGDGEGVCYASEKYFKDKLKIGSKALKKSIQYLIDHKWVENAGRKQIDTKGGIQTSQVYLIKDIWQMNINYYKNKGVSEREPLISKGVFERKQRGVRKEAKGVALEQQIRTTNNNREEEGKKAPTKTFIELLETILPDFKEKLPEKILKEEVQKFILYWTEKNPNGKKCKWEMQQTFDVKRRLATWLKNTSKWDKQNLLNKKPQPIW